MNDFPPQGRSIYVFYYGRNGTVRGILLSICAVVDCSIHKIIVNTYRYVCPGDFACLHLGIDKGLGLGMLDRNSHHQRTTASVLRNLARRIRVALHKWHQAGGRQRRIFHRSTLWPDMTQVVPYSAAALHQLDLFFVDA